MFLGRLAAASPVGGTVLWGGSGEAAVYPSPMKTNCAGRRSPTTSTTPTVTGSGVDRPELPGSQTSPMAGRAPKAKRSAHDPRVVPGGDRRRLNADRREAGDEFPAA